MTGFCFYIGDDQSIVDKMERSANDIWGSVVKKSFDSFSLLMAERGVNASYGESDNSVGAVAGYVRYDNIEYPENGKHCAPFYHNRRFLSEVRDEKRWPLGDNVTGCFSAVSYSKLEKEVALCNDIIGYIPLYYRYCESGLLGGTSLVVLGKALGAEIDVTGVLQRISAGGHYSNLGDRTILKRNKRLLPGEYMKFAVPGRKTSRRFDNTLYSDLQGGTTEGFAEETYSQLNHEIDLATSGIDKLSIALSGGWDSRILLAALSERKGDLSCHTMGASDLYESRLAKQCADYMGCPIEFYPLENRFFPQGELWKKIVSKTESAGFLHWTPLIEPNIDAPETVDEYLVIGGVADSLDGRNILRYSSRMARKKHFMRNLFIPNAKFSVIGPSQFQDWKEELKARVIADICHNRNKLAGALLDECDVETVKEETLCDLELGFKRIADQMPPYVELLDEIFRWFHYTRYFMGSQLLQAGAISNVLVPSMSLRFMRFSSNIDPAIKLRRGLLNAIGRQSGFGKLAKIPTSTIPLVSCSAPVIVQEMIWAGRHSIDNFLIRRMLKSKTVRDNERLLKSFSYAKEYGRSDTISNVSNWYSGRWIDLKPYLDILKKRAELSLWPSVNTDIAVPANISSILDLIHN